MHRSGLNYQQRNYVSTIENKTDNNVMRNLQAVQALTDTTIYVVPQCFCSPPCRRRCSTPDIKPPAANEIIHNCCPFSDPPHDVIEQLRCLDICVASLIHNQDSDPRLGNAKSKANTRISCHLILNNGFLCEINPLDVAMRNRLPAMSHSNSERTPVSHNMMQAN